jgi:dihydroflavonol-4-reductase
MLTLVTGATGLVGNNVVRQLLAAGEQVRVLRRASSDQRPLAGLNVEVATGDVGDPAALERAVQGAARVIHAAAEVRIGWHGLESARAINVVGTRNVAMAALRAGARMVHVSSVDALGLVHGGEANEDTAPLGGILCPYVVTKREAEQAVLDVALMGLDAVIVNPAFMLGPWDWKPSSGRMLLEVARGKTLFAPWGQNSYCDVRDVATAILTAADRGTCGRRYVLAGESLSYYQAWKICARATGGRMPLAAVGPVAVKAAGWLGDLRARLTGGEGDVNSASAAISLQKRVYSSARAAAELGYRSRPLAETARDAWHWFQTNGYT